MKGCVCVVCILLLGSSVDGREHWGPPPLCPPPKADCCPKPCPPKPCKPAPKCEPCTPKCEPQPNCCKKSQCETPCPQRCQDLSPAFNQCAAINIDCGWNVWMDTSFIYFEAMEDNLELAIRANGDPSTILTHGPSDGSVVGIDYSYEPGFDRPLHKVLPPRAQACFCLWQVTLLLALAMDLMLLTPVGIPPLM